jgi:signal transduction histidine kinase
MKFTEQGSIGLAVRSLQDGVEFRVMDTGSGIPPEVQAVMFERFRQGESAMTRHYDGVGLGLYIVKRMLELLEGTVTVESAVGKGSTFSIWIPQEGQKTLAQRSARRKDHQDIL